MQSELFEIFRAIDIPEEKALKAASALSKRGDVRRESLVLKWMMGFSVAFQIAIFVKMFMH